MKALILLVLLFPLLSARTPRNDLEHVTELLRPLDHDACTTGLGRPDRSVYFNAWFTGGKCRGFSHALQGRIYGHQNAAEVQKEMAYIQSVVNAARLQADERPILQISINLFLRVQSAYVEFLNKHPDYAAK